MQNVKFYYDNHVNHDCTFTATSFNVGLSSFLYDRNRNNRLKSMGSNDLTPEVLTIEFSEIKTFDTIMLDNHNSKDGDVAYWQGGTWHVIEGAVWENNTASTNLFNLEEEVQTTKIRITLYSTQTANSEKLLGDVYILKTIGQMQENPETFGDTPYIENKKIDLMDDGGHRVTLQGRKYTAQLKFTFSNNSDVELYNTLSDLGDAFFIHPGGGHDNAPIGFRLRDIFLVVVTGRFNPVPSADLFDVGMSFTLEVGEV